MSIEFLFIESKQPKWSSQLLLEYQEKLNKFIPTSINWVKSPALSRSERGKKVELEGKLILSKLSDKDILCLLDERGKKLNSIDFSKWLSGQVSSLGKNKLIFLIGGAFGVSEEVKERANYKTSFSDLTFSHLIAQAVLLEQVYRGFTIINEIPYHNA